MSKLIALVILAFGAAAAANAGVTPPTTLPPPPSWWPYPKPVRAPEIDPALALGGLTLLAGGIAVVRGRRTKK